MVCWSSVESSSSISSPAYETEQILPPVSPGAHAPIRTPALD